MVNEKISVKHIKNKEKKKTLNTCCWHKKDHKYGHFIGYLLAIIF